MVQGYRNTSEVAHRSLRDAQVIFRSISVCLNDDDSCRLAMSVHVSHTPQSDTECDSEKARGKVTSIVYTFVTVSLLHTQYEIL